MEGSSNSGTVTRESTMESDASIGKQSSMEGEDSEPDGVIFPTKSKKQRNFALLDSDDELSQKQTNNLREENSITSTLSPPHEKEFDNINASGKSYGIRNFGFRSFILAHLRHFYCKNIL